MLCHHVKCTSRCVVVNVLKAREIKRKKPGNYYGRGEKKLEKL